MLIWNQSLSVNVAEIDQQHKKLVNLINKLNEAMGQGQSNQVLGGIINELISYTRTHFAYEEQLFAKFNFPDSEQHIKAHRSFINKVSKFKDDFTSGKMGVSIEILNYLGEWLKKHIMGTDKKYSQFLNDNGVK